MVAHSSRALPHRVPRCVPPPSLSGRLRCCRGGTLGQAIARHLGSPGGGGMQALFFAFSFLFLILERCFLFCFFASPPRFFPQRFSGFYLNFVLVWKIPHFAPDFPPIPKFLSIFCHFYFFFWSGKSFFL